MNAFKMPASTPKGDKKKSFWRYCLLFLFLMGVFHTFLGAISYNAFVMMDNVLHASGSNSPLFMWIVMGSLLGAFVGSIVASIKFKLANRIKVLVGLPALVLIFSLLFAAEPLGTIASTETAFDPDTTQTGIADLPVAIKADARKKGRRKTPPRELKTLPKAEDKERQELCETELNGVSVVVRSDSVRLFYRVAMKKNGEWRPWQSILIPQPGQYSLSGPSGKVIANSIQYYYESGHESTKSASDPFTKNLCDGALAIDTY